VNPHAGAQQLLIYLEGGGACSDDTTCWGPSPGATNLTGFNGVTFSTDKEPHYPAFDRTPATGSPFAAMNMVFIPYCTGDMHSGETTASLSNADGGTTTTYFWGGRDMDIFLPRLVASYGSATRVYLLGTSAGGFGTMLNLERVATAFPAGVDILDDSGPAILSNHGTSNTALLTAWGTPRPSGCPSPCDKFSDFLAYDLTLQAGFSPTGRFGFLSFEEDTTIAPDFGYSIAQYPGVLATFVATLPGPPATATYLVANHQGHVVESDLSLAPDYLVWMGEMVSRSAAWGMSGHDGG